MRRGPGTLYRLLESLRFLATRDRGAVVEFLRARHPRATIKERLRLLRSYLRITHRVRGYHTLAEMLVITDRILRRSGRRDLLVVEAGAGKGSSTAKLSLAVRAAGGRLLVFDSFRGIPANDEVHEHIDGRRIVFREGAFLGRLGSVKRTVEEHGAIDVCEFIKGPFEETMCGFDRAIDVAILDVDLVASTRTCIRALYPRLRADGVLFTQDGHLRATVELLSNAAFWRDEVGVEVPTIEGLGVLKLLELEAGRVHRANTRPSSSSIA